VNGYDVGRIQGFKANGTVISTPFIPSPSPSPNIAFLHKDNVLDNIHLNIHHFIW
jgi:hypothetical protein